MAWLTYRAKEEAVREANGDGALLSAERYDLWTGANPYNSTPRHLRHATGFYPGVAGPRVDDSTNRHKQTDEG